MNLGFDFDKIFIDYPPFIPSALIDRLYKKKANGTLLYRIPSGNEQVLRLLTHHPLLRPLIKDNIAFIQNLSKKKKHKHYLISSRFGFLKNTTEKLIKKHGFDKMFDEMFFNFENKQPHIFKNDVLKKLHIDRYVDDDLPLLEFLKKDHKKTKFFWLNKNNNKALGKNLFAITHLSQMLMK